MGERSSGELEPVPRRLGAVLDPAWLAWALDDVSDGDRIVAVDQVGSSKTVAEKVRFSVTVEDREGNVRTGTYCVKAHFDDDGPNSLGPEARFYRDLAPRVGIRTPRAYYTGLDEASGAAIVIMDDVVGQGGSFLGAHEPYSVETAAGTLSQLAKLHAATWADPVPSGCDWLEPRVLQTSERVPTDFLQQLMDDGRADGVAPELRDAELLKEAVRRTASLPRTCVLHGDTHSGNVYLDAQARPCWLDWQLVQPGNWATDVGYHLSTVLSVEDRRSHEADLLRHYLDELGRLGVDPPGWSEAWDLYARSFAFGWFLWSITRISSRAVVLEHVPRIAAAMEDHRTYERLGLLG